MVGPLSEMNKQLSPYPPDRQNECHSTCTL